jgi:ATP-binding cassette subfamily C protein LapB
VYEIGEGNLTMGGLIAVTIISGRALQPLAQVANVMVQWQQAKASLQGLEAMMQSPIDGELAEHDGKLIMPATCGYQLSLREIVFGYDPKYPAIQIPQLFIKSGERVAIVGPVGSGKSTLLKLLSGLYQPTSGRAFLDDVDMAHLEPVFLRSHIHYFPQDARLFNGTLRDNLVFGHDVDPGDEAILKAVRATGLDELISAHPRGLGLYINEGGHGLSGGQRQLVALTRLLLVRKGIMLLDEPTAAMDGNTEERIANVMVNAVPEQGALVLVTHKLNLLKHVQRVIVMDKGRVVLDGSRDAVLAKIMPQPPVKGA